MVCTYFWGNLELQVPYMVVSHAQTAFLWWQRKKGSGILLLHMSCAENRQVLAIVDWPLIGVDRLQRCSARMTYVQGGL